MKDATIVVTNFLDGKLKVPYPYHKECPHGYTVIPRNYSPEQDVGGAVAIEHALAGQLMPSPGALVIAAAWTLGIRSMAEVDACEQSADSGYMQHLCETVTLSGPDTERKMGVQLLFRICKGYLRAAMVWRFDENTPPRVCLVEKTPHGVLTSLADHDYREGGHVFRALVALTEAWFVDCVVREVLPSKQANYYYEGKKIDVKTA